MYAGLAEAKTSAGAPRAIWSAELVRARELKAGRGRDLVEDVGERRCGVDGRGPLGAGRREAGNERNRGGEHQAKGKPALHRSTITDVDLTIPAALMPA